MDYYKRYMGDYQRDTGHLSLAAHGAFTVLLDHYYSKRKPLPANLEDLYRLCRAMTKQEQAAVKLVAEEFFPVCADGLRHSRRADQEIEKWDELMKEASESGKRGAEVRWGKKIGHPMANPMLAPSKTNGVPHVNPNANPNGGKDGGKHGSPAPIPAPIPKPLPEPDLTSEPELETRTRASSPRAKPVSAAVLLEASRNGEKGAGESEAEILRRTVVAMLQSGSSPAEIVRTMPARGLTVEQVADIAREQSP
jgi:uncharacterized protein YdaU (DUF1376 family)